MNININKFEEKLLCNVGITKNINGRKQINQKNTIVLFDKKLVSVWKA